MTRQMVEVFIFILPVILAGLTFIVFIKKEGLVFLRYPIDFNLKYRGRIIFGKNKTWQGPVLMSLFTVFYAWIIIFVSKNAPFDVFWNVSNSSGVIKLLILGCAYSAAELPNSFIKRLLNIGPGEISSNRLQRIIFYVADKADSVLGVVIASWLFYGFSIEFLAIMFFEGILAHSLTDILMKHLKLKK